MFEFRKYKNEAFQPTMIWPHAEWHKLKTVIVSETTTSPVAAAYLLEHCNDKNRHLTESKAQYFGRLMTTGKWFLTGEPLILDNTGTGISLQHRLKGCVYAGVEFPTLVVIDVDPAVGDWVDNVRAKTVADRLGAAETPHANALASILRIMYCWRHTGVIGRIHRYQFDMDQAYETLDVFPGLAESAAFCSKNTETSKFFRGPGALGTLHWLMEQVGTGLGAEFLNMAASNRIPTDAKWNVVAKLNKQLGSWRKGAVIGDVTGLTLKAWNAWRTDKEVKNLILKPDEGFPKINGWEYDKKGLPVKCGTFVIPAIKHEEQND